MVGLPSLCSEVQLRTPNCMSLLITQYTIDYTCIYVPARICPSCMGRVTWVVFGSVLS